jgi:ADP-ribose pyrophosphatase
MSARILERRETWVSPWVRLVAKDVEFQPGSAPERYHCFGQSDYVVVLARTPEGLIPIVQQYRPAVDDYPWEFPAGLLETDEDPETCCRRELKEEAGLDVLALQHLGTCYPDTGRLENRIHVFFARTTAPDPDFIPEPGMALQFVDEHELHAQVRSGVFRHQLHLGVLTLARVNGVL